MVRVHIEDAELVDPARGTVEVLSVGAFEVPEEAQPQTFRQEPLLNRLLCCLQPERDVLDSTADRVRVFVGPCAFYWGKRHDEENAEKVSGEANQQEGIGAASRHIRVLPYCGIGEQQLMRSHVDRRSSARYLVL